MSLSHLHTALARAKSRHLYAKRNLDSELNSVLATRATRGASAKLEQDLTDAECDVGYAMHAIEHAMGVEGLNF
jgi:hypothetical protein